MRLIKLWLFAAVALSSCNDQNNSEQKWAQFKTEETYGSIPARLLYLSKNYVNERSKVRVCVQESKQYSGNELLLEVKMAYAAWIEGYGGGNEATWNLLDFVLQEKCSYKDKTFDAVVVIASYEKRDADQYKPSFESMSCTPTDRTGSVIRVPAFNCNIKAFISGLGGPGSANFANKKVIFYSPTQVTLNPYIEWASLETEFKYQLAFKEAETNKKEEMELDGFRGESKLTAENLKDLLSTYTTLKASANTLSFREIDSFNQKLKAMNYKASNHLDFEPSPFSVDSYRRKKSAYRTLLHEVGHTFGMAHAHYPEYKEPTGSSQTTKESDGVWTTEDAAMAYGDEYTFLTEDDRLGILDLQKKLSKIIE